MILSPCSKLDEAELKLEDSREKRIKHTLYKLCIALGFYYSKEGLAKENQYFSYGEDCGDEFAEEIEKNLYDFASFLKQKNDFYRERTDKILIRENLLFV